MIATKSKFEILGSKDSFNSTVRHVKATVSLAESVASGENLADTVNELLDDKQIAIDQVQAFISMLLVDKFGYVGVSKNLMAVSLELAKVHESAKTWDAVDMVVLYHHPDVGPVLVNPKNPQHLAKIDRLNRFELITVYAGGFSKGIDQRLAERAASTLIGLYEGRPVKVDATLLKGVYGYKARKVKEEVERPSPKAPKAVKAAKGAAKKTDGAPKKAAGKAGLAEQPVPQSTGTGLVSAVPKKGARMTPMYAVPVTNELFHNGNVEAWKRIIESYRTKHPDLEVLVYYDGERITNLNALFKWGKVKHGSVIQFAVAGENICDVAKLQRYLAQGASKMFEAFLRGPVNSVLPLF